MKYADLDIGAIIGGNAHIYYCLIDARTQAAEYLQSVIGRLPEGSHASIEQASAYFAEVANKLDTGWDFVPWPWQLKSATDWTMERRRYQAALLGQALELERHAVENLEDALNAVES